MKRISKIMLLGGVAAAAFVALLAALFLLMPGGGEDTAQAAGGDGSFPTIFGIDVDPYTAGDNNTATYMGAVENCIEVSNGETFDIDVFIDDIPTGKDLSGADFFMYYDENYLRVNGWVGPFGMGCVDWLLYSRAGSALCQEFGDTTWPDTDGSLSVSIVDGNLAGAEQPGDRGVLNRYEMEVVQAGPQDVYITFAPAPTYFAPSVGLRYDPDQVWDGNYSPWYGVIAIDKTCPVPNDPPTADDKTPSTNEDTPVTITLTGSDVETCELTFSIVDDPDHGSLGGITDDVCTAGSPNTDSADVDYTPTGDYDGPDSFTYKVNDGQDDSSAATVSITVNPINDAPDVTGPASMTVPEDQANTASTTIADVDDTTFTCAVVTGSEPTHGNVTFGANCASVTYTATDADYNGSDSFTFRVTDSGGGQGAGNELYDDQAVSVTITPVNDAPNVTAPTSMTVPEDSNATESTTITDIDDTTFTCAVVSGSEPTHGNVTFGANCGDVTYTATDLNYNGSDSFTFRVTDSGGGQGAGNELYDDQAVSVTITPVQDAPVCNNLNVATYPDTPVAVTLDCSDPDVGDTLTYTIVTGPSHGTLSGTAPDLTYTPDPGYIGDDSFTYKANDTTVDSNTATASITVTEDLPPTCNDLTITTPQDTSVAVILDCTDPEGDTLTYTIVTDPSHGTLSGTAPNLTYTPESGYVGSDSSTYEANDGTSDSNTATVSITVTEVAPPVTASPTPTATATPPPPATPTPTPVAVESALAAEAAAGSQEISVEDTEGFAVGDTIQIGTGDTAETCTITDISDSTLTLDCTLEFDHAAGEAVVVAAPPTTPAEVCAPVIPGTYHGSVRLDGVPAPSGKVLKALIGEVEWASTTVVGGLYALDIPETLPATSPCFEGGTITFAVEGYVCSPSPDWASGLHAVDVSCEVAAAPTPEPTPEVTPTPGVTPTPVAPPPTGGGGLLHGGSAAWTAALAAAGVLALLLTAVGLSRGARKRTR